MEQKNFITKERENAILSHTPMSRYGEPNELIGASIWLGSDASSFVTGSEVTIDGDFMYDHITFVPTIKSIKLIRFIN